MDPLTAEQEAEEGLRFSVIVQSPDICIKTSICILEEGDMHDGPVCTRKHDALFPMPSEGEEANLPFEAAYCHLDRSHFFFGGTLYMEPPNEVLYDLGYRESRFVISASSPPAGSWEICGTIPDPGRHLIAVPYGRKIYLFGSPGLDVQVYDPRSRRFSRRRPVPLNFGRNLCMSYFIWRTPQNPLIMLVYRAPDFVKAKLLSYHAGDDRWETFDPDFPSNWNPPFLLPGTDKFVIMDQPDSWRIYDLSTRELTGETVSVDGMQEDLRNHHRKVIRTFCRRSSCGSFLVFAFIDGYYNAFPVEIAYATIRLAQGQKGYVAAVESQGDLMVGPNCGAYISAEPSTKRKGASSS